MDSSEPKKKIARSLSKEPQPKIISKNDAHKLENIPSTSKSVHFQTEDKSSTFEMNVLNNELSASDSVTYVNNYPGQSYQ